MPRIQTFNTFGQTIDYAEISSSARSALLIHRKVFTDATERTTISSNFTDLGYNFVLSAPVNSLVLGLYFQGISVTNDNGEKREICIALEGVTLGVQAVQWDYCSWDGTTAYRAYKWASSVGRAGYIANNGNTQLLNMSKPLKLLDATTAVNIYAKSGNNKTAGFSNVSVVVIYAPNFVED